MTEKGMSSFMENAMKAHRRRMNQQGVPLARRRLSQARRSAARGLFVEQLEDRRLLAASPLVPTLDPPVVRFELELQDSSGVKIEPLTNGGIVQTDAAGDPIYRVHEGDYFRVQLYADDLRTPDALVPGVFSAVLDVAYSDPSLFSMNGTKPDAFSDLAAFQNFFTESDYYSNLESLPSAANLDGDQVPNEFDEISLLNDWFGAANKLRATADKLPLVYVTLKADAAGKLTFQANPSEQNPPESNVIMLPDDPLVDLMVALQSIDFGLPLHVTIEKQVDAKDDAYTVSQTTSSTLDVLLNDTLETLSTGTKLLLQASQTPTDLSPAHGIASISNGKVLYTPTTNYVGTDAFTYTAVDGLGNSDTATVTVTVYNVFTNNSQNTLYHGDFNGDGYSDIAIATSQENNNGIAGDNDLAWHAMLGSASGLASPQPWSPVNGFSGERFYVADLDGDGKDDILSSTTRINGNGIPGDNDLAWHLMRSTGTQFSSEVQLNNSYGVYADKYYVGDFNGDAKDDILISTTRVNVNGIVGDNDLAWYLMRSNGSTFLDGGQINGSYGLDVDKYYAADFNGDGKDDILVSTTRINHNGVADNDLAWYLMRSNGSTFLDGGRINDSYGLDSDKYYVTDLSGDGKDDMVISTTRINGNAIDGDDDLAWYLMRSDGSTFLDGGQSNNSYGRDVDMYFAFKINTDTKEDLITVTSRFHNNGDYDVYGAISDGTKCTDDGQKY
ncbi:MAG: FG-GAP-like repeat-containing protein [Pirellulaceae bacterium]